MAIAQSPILSPDGPPPRRGPSVLVVPVLLIGMAALIVGVSVSSASASKQAKKEAAATSTTGGAHETAAVVAPKAYDPQSKNVDAKKVDLSGVAGVTPAQQARAEKLVAITLEKLPQFATQEAAKAKGFHSINDGFTGAEHLINWDYINDDHVLDPDYPESLVYDTTGPTKKLVSAMFMLSTGSTLDTVPDIGGPLTQWHIHDNLCFANNNGAPIVAGITTSDGTCRAPLQKLTPVPMIHVWIVANPCGPFAALEGTGAGQIKPGETRACDKLHSH